MFYQLHEDVSYCQIDGRLIFLDMNQDRYFQLSDQLERAFFASVHEDAQPSIEVEDLVRKHILTLSSNTSYPPRYSKISYPSKSAIECKSTTLNLHFHTLLEVFAIVCSTQLQLKTRRLKSFIQAQVELRQRKACDIPTTSDISLLVAAQAFRHARPYVPIDTCCLLDSLSLLQFLSRRRLFANLVFGVTRDPFAAHCWVQARDWVLNDTVGNVIAYTPIREV